MAEESVSERVSDAAADAWSATKKTAKDVGNAVEKKVDELKNDSQTKDNGKVKVTLDDSMIKLPESLPAGATTFVVTNTGKKTHGFGIKGAGIEFKKIVEPGETSTLTVDLKPGTYEAECSAEGHEDKRMKQTFIVK